MQAVHTPTRVSFRMYVASLLITAFVAYQFGAGVPARLDGGGKTLSLSQRAAVQYNDRSSLRSDGDTPSGLQYEVRTTASNAPVCPSAAAPAPAGQPSAAAAVAAPPSQPAPPEGTPSDPLASLITEQLCYAAGDESEICAYDGPLCVDVAAGSLVVVVPDGQTIRGWDNTGRGRNACLDWRQSESQQNCGYAQPAFREPPQRPASPADCADPEGWASHSHCAAASLTTPHAPSERGWGPDVKAFWIREMELSAFAALTGAQGEGAAVSLKDGSRDTVRTKASGNRNATRDMVAAVMKRAAQGLWGKTDGDRGRYLQAQAPHGAYSGINGSDAHAAGARQGGRRLTDDSSKRSVAWLDGALWVVPMMSGWIDHPWHSASAIMALWSAKRHNASVLVLPTGQDAASKGGPQIEQLLLRQRRAAAASADGTQAGATASEWMADSTREAGGQTAGRGPKQRGYRITAGGIALPPMDYVAMLQGDDAKPRDGGLQSFSPWLQGNWPILTQPQSVALVMPTIRKLVAKLQAEDPSSGGVPLVCARRGAVTGLQPRLFSGTADAAAYRTAAWQVAGVPLVPSDESAIIKAMEQTTAASPPAAGAPLHTAGLPYTRPHDQYPPRKITVLSRAGTRGLIPEAGVSALLDATGLAWEWVSDMGSRSWESQVALMAGTGIVLASHGAALTNIMYMPLHAVVIEAFPYIMNWPLYRRLADAAGLTYYRLAAPYPEPLLWGNEQFQLFAGLPDGGKPPPGEFEDYCEDPQRVPSIDANWLVSCNGRSKNSMVNVDLALLAETLATSLDDVGCRPRQFGPSAIAALRSGRKEDPAWPKGVESLQDVALVLVNSSHLAPLQEVPAGVPASSVIDGGRWVNLRGLCHAKGTYYKDKSPWARQLRGLESDEAPAERAWLAAD